MSLEIDYSKTGLNIQKAMVDYVKKNPNKKDRLDYINWNGLQIKTSDCWHVESCGLVRFEILSVKAGVEQGFDAKVDGWFELEGGEKVPLLRTWKEDRFEDVIQYPFFTRDGRLYIWNIYKKHYPDGHIAVEKWTGNAGFWVEQVADDERIYHCSHGSAVTPDFESLIFSVRVARTL